MLNDLSSQQLALAEYMSELSEEAFAAMWMTDLKFALYQALLGERKTFGRLDFNEEIISRLKELSQKINGWIYFDDDREETYVGWEQWQEMMKKCTPKY